MPCSVARVPNRDESYHREMDRVSRVRARTISLGLGIRVDSLGTTRFRREQKGSFRPTSRLRISTADLATARFALDGFISKDVRYGVIVSFTISTGRSRDVFLLGTSGVDGWSDIWQSLRLVNERFITSFAAWPNVPCEGCR